MLYLPLSGIITTVAKLAALQIEKQGKATFSI